jgi:rod shape determining protein RodA
MEILLNLNNRILSHFDFFTLILVIPIVITSHFLLLEANEVEAARQLLYFGVGAIGFAVAFVFPIRKLAWLIPYVYWISVILLVFVIFTGVAKNGAQRWLTIPVINLNIQPSEIIKPAFLLMLAYVINLYPPPKGGYGLFDFCKISIYILIPFGLIFSQPDLGTAILLLLIGFGVLFIVGVNWKIWAVIVLGISFLSPLGYTYLLKDYQKKRVTQFLNEKSGYQVRQSIISIGSGGMTGKRQDEATQVKLKFLPIATSDFLFAYHVERFGFIGAFFLMFVYIILVIHLFSLGTSTKDYFIKTFAVGVSFMIFLYMSLNIAMTLNFAPTVGLPLPFFSYGGSSFVNFMFLFGMMQHLWTFRFSGT